MTTKRIIPAVLLLILIPAMRSLAQFPQAEISNGLIHAKLYLPDAKSGYYRAMRFDWAGVMPSLIYKGHEFFGEWFDRHDPLRNDGIVGPVEGILPLGFTEAAAGENFIMVGVGSVKKPDDKAWSFGRNYEIMNGGKWTVKTKKDRVEFTHQLKDANGYAYIYTKTVRLVKGKPVLLLEHSLKNTGLRPIETSVYNHNFFMIDKQTTGPDFSVTVPFKLTADMAPKDMISFNGNQIVFNRVLRKGEDAFTHFTGFSSNLGDYDILIRNKLTGSGVRITSDRPLQSFNFWTISTTLCPEPYIAVSAAPGKEFTWTTTYEFEARD